MVDDAAGRADRGPETVLHTAAELSLGGPRLRQQCWDEIAAPVRERLNELAGPVLYWWATPVGHDDAAPKAIVFGERGLYFAEPQAESGNPPEYRISGYDIVSGSMTVDDVEYSPAPGDERPSAAVGEGTESETSDGPDIGLLPDVKGVLGNLPPQAQQLLQAPFATGLRVGRAEYFYEGFPHHLYIFVLFLVGDDDLTIATGTKLIPDGHSDATAHWTLQIHRALVTARPGE